MEAITWASRASAQPAAPAYRDCRFRSPGSTARAREVAPRRLPHRWPRARRRAEDRQDRAHPAGSPKLSSSQAGAKARRDQRPDMRRAGRRHRRRSTAWALPTISKAALIARSSAKCQAAPPWPHSRPAPWRSHRRSLDRNHRGTFVRGRACRSHVVERCSFVEERRLRRVEVLGGHVRFERPPAKAMTRLRKSVQSGR